MKKVFLDSSVLIAACASLSGASALILGYCREGKIQGYVSLDVIGEARKNIILKLNERGRKRLVFYLKAANLKISPQVTSEEIFEAEMHINLKDAPILASAVKTSASHLITLDRKHFFAPEVIKFAKELKIISPGDFVKQILKPV